MTPPLPAQTTEADILAQLKGRPLFLRGCPKDDDLSFDHAGKPASTYAPRSFTLSGIDVERVRVQPDSLEIQGQRMGLEYKGGAAPERVRLKWHRYSGKITLHLAGHPGDDFGPALHAIFAPDLDALIPSPGLYWRAACGRYRAEAAVPDESDEDVVGDAPDKVAPDTPGPSAPPSDTKPLHVGGSVKPPALMSQVDPSFSEAARGLRYSGKVKVELWVDGNGLPFHLTVVKPAGLGLDEEALAAVAQYRFKPATRNGSPVVVDLYVDVNFRIF